jgi:hypothetical protein
MNPSVSPLGQIVGNCCVGLAFVLYAFPLQVLLWELAHKKNDSAGGAIAGLIILVPMWLLLWVALWCVTASGGFDWLPFNRPVLHALVIATTLALAVVSVVFMGMLPRSGFLERIVICAPIYLFPVATMLLAIPSLNPQLAPEITPQMFRLLWTVFAALSLAGGLSFVGYHAVRTGVGRVVGIAHRFGQVGPSSSETLAKISTLDPEHDFADLLSLADPSKSRPVREAATTRLRTNPDFIGALVADLNSRNPSASLAFVYDATFSPVELAKLAQPTRQAIERFTDGIPAPNYMSAERRKELKEWGRRTLPIITDKFAGTQVDFKPALSAFEQALAPPQRGGD